MLFGILAFSYRQFHVSFLLSLHPLILICSDSCVLFCIRASTYPQVICFWWSFMLIDIVVSSHYSLRPMCSYLYPNVLSSSHSQNRMCLLVHSHTHVFTSSGSCILLYLHVSLRALLELKDLIDVQTPLNLSLFSLSLPVGQLRNQTLCGPCDEIEIFFFCRHPKGIQNDNPEPTFITICDLSTSLTKRQNSPLANLTD